MNELLIMRHAKSDWSTGHDDFSRPLNDRGSRAADRMAAWLREQNLCPDHVLSSPAIRASTTAMAVVYACGVDRDSVEFEDDAYLASAYTWRQLISRQPSGRLLICGHNPGLDDLVDYLSGSTAPETVSGKLTTTAAIAHFDVDAGWPDLTPATSTLVQLVRPRELV